MQFSDYSQKMKQNQIDLVRRFNRAVTQRIGALDDAYLSRGRSLGLSRLLWEIEPAGSEARLLRARLGLDSGYFTRSLKQSISTRELGSSRWSPSIMNRMRTIGSRKISDSSDS